MDTFSRGHILSDLSVGLCWWCVGSCCIVLCYTIRCSRWVVLFICRSARVLAPVFDGSLIYSNNYGWMLI